MCAHIGVCYKRVVSKHISKPSRFLFHSSIHTHSNTLVCHSVNVCVSHGQQIKSIDCVIAAYIKPARAIHFYFHLYNFPHFVSSSFLFIRIHTHTHTHIHAIFLAILLNYSEIYESLVCAFIRSCVLALALEFAGKLNRWVCNV